MTTEVLDERIVCRPIRPDDADRLRRLFGRLSPETVYRRFFSPISNPPEAALRRLATVDHDDREALVAVVDDEIIAVARYDRSAPGAPTAEVAIVVEDAWHGHHVATWLLDRLSRLAVRRGITTFTATALANNSPILSLMRHMNPRAHVTFEGGELLAELPLGHTQAA